MPRFIIFGLIAWVCWISITTLLPYIFMGVFLIGILNYLIEGWNLFIRQGVPLCIAEGILACWGLFHLNRWLNNEYDLYPPKHEQSIVASYPRISPRQQDRPRPEFDEFDLTEAQKRHVRRLQRAARRAG